jgi:hypothetical protein
VKNLKNRKTIVIIVYIAILVLSFAWMMGLFSGDGQELTYSEIVSLFYAKQPAINLSSKNQSTF